MGRKPRPITQLPSDIPDPVTGLSRITMHNMVRLAQHDEGMRQMLSDALVYYILRSPAYEQKL